MKTPRPACCEICIKRKSKAAPQPREHKESGRSAAPDPARAPGMLHRRPSLTSQGQARRQEGSSTRAHGETQLRPCQTRHSPAVQLGRWERGTPPRRTGTGCRSQRDPLRGTSPCWSSPTRLPPKLTLNTHRLAHRSVILGKKFNI